MAFTKGQIISAMKETGVVPLFTHDDIEEASAVLEAAYRAGVRVFEFTNRRKNSFEVFSELVKRRASRFPDLMLGIGTVMDGESAEAFIAAGADFIISPIIKPDMAPVCHRNGKLWIPGCATTTEVALAREHGAEVIKIFPGSVLGPSFVSSIIPVIPGLQYMITGGVEPTEENLSKWFNAGAMCVGMGSQLFTKQILVSRDWEELTRTIQTALVIVKKLKT